MTTTRASRQAPSRRVVKRGAALAAVWIAAGGVIATALRPVGAPSDFAEHVEAFYAAEAARVVSFGAAAPSPPAFDVLLVHVCSMSWDDLGYVGLDDEPFFAAFDVWFTRFNTATTSGDAAAIRLLRSACGQARHADLRESAPAECYLLDRLREAGFRTSTVLNHSGEYRGITDDVATLGRADAALDLSGLPVAATAADGRPIFDDYATLRRWWSGRVESGAERAAAYYHTITLQAGARPVRVSKHADAGKRWYEAGEHLFDDLSRFFGLVEASGRNLVVVFLPDHGRGLRPPRRLRRAYVRSLPLPTLTDVPLGLELRGRNWVPGPPRTVPGPVSYHAVAYVLAEMLRDNPFASGAARLEHILDTVPHTEPLAEDDGGRRVARLGGAAYFEDEHGRSRRISEH